jgi:membrane protease YdiL (CAAX protease family)
MSNAAPRLPRLAVLSGLFVSLILPAILSAGAPGELPSGLRANDEILINEAVIWAMALAVLAIVLFWERLPLSSIGFRRPSWGAFFAGAAVTGGLMAVALAAAGLIAAAGFPIDNQDQENLVIGLPIWLQVLVVISAGITEEILFRGYPIERITALTGRRWLGALLPVIVFGAVHAPFWGVAHAVVAGFEGLLLTAVYVWRRNLWINITAHALLDGLVFVALDIATSRGTVNV